MHYKPSDLSGEGLTVVYHNAVNAPAKSNDYCPSKGDAGIYVRSNKAPRKKYMRDKKDALQNINVALLG